MVEESTRRIPSELAAHVNFLLLTTADRLPFDDASIDIVCSKGGFALGISIGYTF